VERREAVRAPRVGSGEAVRLSKEKPVPWIVRAVGRDRMEDSIPAAVRSVHERAEAAVVADAERVAIPLDQPLYTSGVACVDELENGHVRDY
jgi:hypothetical protein